MRDLAMKWALVTGASSGLGIDFAKELAKRGANVVLAARREEQLEEVKQSLEKEFGIHAYTITIDLSEKDAPKVLFDELKRQGIEIEVLVNNAGFGLFGRFDELPWNKERNMLELDIITLTHMTKLFMRDMQNRKSGYILQVASIGAFQPTPLYASYSAAKSYVLNFSEAINYELRGTGVSSTVISPGITATEFLKVSGQKPTLYQRTVMMKSRDVARIGIQAMLRRRSGVVPGLVNALTAWSTRLMPRSLQARVAHILMKS